MACLVSMRKFSYDECMVDRFKQCRVFCLGERAGGSMKKQMKLIMHATFCPGHQPHAPVELVLFLAWYSYLCVFKLAVIGTHVHGCIASSTVHRFHVWLEAKSVPRLVDCAGRPFTSHDSINELVQCHLAQRRSGGKKTASETKLNASKHIVNLVNRLKSQHSLSSQLP